MMKIWILMGLLACPCWAQSDRALSAPSSVARSILYGDSQTSAYRISYPDVVPLSLGRNLRLLADQIDVPIARAQLDEARAARNPTFANNFSYLHQDATLVRQDLPNTRFLLLAAGSTLAQSTLYTLGQNEMLNRTTLYIPVYTGGRLESAIHLQAALLQVAKIGLERTTQIIAFQTKQQYLQTVLALDNILVARKVEAQAQKILVYAQDRLGAGIGTKLDVLQAQVAMANAQDTLVKTTSSAAKARTDLAALLQLPLLTQFEFLDSLRGSRQSLEHQDLGERIDSSAPTGAQTILKNEPIFSHDLKELIKTGLGLRPELRQLRARLVANHESENIAISGTLPTLELNLNHDVTADPARLEDGETMVVGLTIPIYDGGLARAKVKEIHVLRNEINNDEEQQVQSIMAEIRKASLDVEESDARLDQARVAQERAAEALRIASLRYQVGAGTSLELVTAQAVLANAEFSLADAHYRQVLARATLNLALGVSPPMKTVDR